jgi:hypothetical protein
MQPNTRGGTLTRQIASTKPRTSVWIPAHAAPFNRDLELCVVDGQDVQVFTFPCRRTENGWKDTGGDRPLDIAPTHWRDW